MNYKTMKKISFAALVFAACLASANVEAQSLLNRAKRAVSGTVDNALDRVLSGKKSDPSYNDSKSTDYIETTRGSYRSDEDPYQDYVDRLAAEFTPNNHYEVYKSYTDYKENTTTLSFNSFSDVVAGIPEFPGVRQIGLEQEQRAAVEVVRNFMQAMENYMSEYIRISNELTHQVSYANADAITAESNSAPTPAEINKAVEEGAKKLGKKVNQLTDEEMIQILTDMDKNVLAQPQPSTGAGGQGSESIIDRIYDIGERAVKAAGMLQKLENKLDELAPVICARWADAEAKKQVYDNECDIDKRTVQLWKKDTSEKYPEFWKEGRREQNKIIDGYNLQQAEEWRNAILAYYEPVLSLFKEMADADAQLEKLTEGDKKLNLDYINCKQQLISAYTIVSGLIPAMQQLAFDVPLVANVLVDNQE